MIPSTAEYLVCVVSFFLRNRLFACCDSDAVALLSDNLPFDTQGLFSGSFVEFLLHCDYWG